jgi:hypothetical protein
MLVSLFAVGALLVVNSAVRADSIPWAYSATDTVIFNNNNPIQTSSIIFKGSSGAATDMSGFIIYNLTSTSTADTTMPDSFTNVPFNLSVMMTDVKSTGSKDPSKVSQAPVTFSGGFNATNVTKSSLFPGTVNWTTPTEAVVTLGSNDTGWRKYTVDVVSFTPPGHPGGAPGAILAEVQVAPGTGPGGSGSPPPDAPEPTTLLLAGLALPGFWLARRRMKAQAA